MTSRPTNWVNCCSRCERVDNSTSSWVELSCVAINPLSCLYVSFLLHVKYTVSCLIVWWRANVIIVPRRIIWSWYTGRWWVGCYIWYSEEGTGRLRSPPKSLLAVPNVTADPSTATASVYQLPITVWSCCSCGFNVHVKGLTVNRVLQTDFQSTNARGYLLTLKSLFYDPNKRRHQQFLQFFTTSSCAVYIVRLL